MGPDISVSCVDVGAQPNWVGVLVTHHARSGDRRHLNPSTDQRLQGSLLPSMTNIVSMSNTLLTGLAKNLSRPANGPWTVPRKLGQTCCCESKHLRRDSGFETENLVDECSELSRGP